MNIDLKDITSIEFDSRMVQDGSLFVATRGTLTDGHNYIESAVERGAKVVVCEELPAVKLSGIEYIEVEDSHSALSHLAAEFYDFPSKQIKLVGVTGTNGKTTTATLLYNLFTTLGYKCGLLSTVENRIGSGVSPATHTTPNAVELNRLLREMVDSGCSHCFMEVSSHALVQRRVEAVEFCGGIFTNLTHDHLDYHGSFAEYLKAKKSFFDALPKGAFALTNLDDRNGEVMLQNCKALHRGYSLRTISHYSTKIVESHLDGTLLRINNTEIWVQLIGRFNAYNITAIYGTAIELGEDREEVLAALSTLQSVGGRFETIRGNDGRLAVVDYAHTPDALRSVLETISEVCKGSHKDSKIITVVGCGGDRDKLKRPIMALLAVQHSDQVILTSDNPRSENPNAILDDMISGLTAEQQRQTLTIENRSQAIKTAAVIARPSDVILIAGKGHETYQEIAGIRNHFDDKEEIRIAFEK